MDHGAILLEDGLKGRAGTKKGALSIRWTHRYFSPTLKKTREIGCGIWPVEKMKTIRVRRDGYRLLLSQSLDPLDEAQAAALEGQRHLAEERASLAEREAQAATEAATLLTVDSLMLAWLKDGVRHRDGNKEITWRYEKYIKVGLGPIPVKLLTEDRVRGHLKELVARGMNRTAVHVRDNLTAAFRWAERRQPWRRLLIDGNPLDLIDIKQIVDIDYDNIRTRKLSEVEIAELGTILHTIRYGYEQAAAGTKYMHLRPIQEDTELAVWIMLSTLCRVGELSKAEWRYVDFDARTWHVPRDHVKKLRGNVHTGITISLSDFAFDLFKRLHLINGNTPYLIPARRGDKGHINEQAITKQITDRQAMFCKTGKAKQNRKQDNSLVLSKGSNGNWTSHDLRRTGATLMQSLGITPVVIDFCQNHVLEGSKTRRHYMQHPYIAEMKVAWTALGQYLLLMKNAKNGDA
ncbi:tyrosine-type recombinase/integrase [Paralcaligenes ureilyticus]|uniref:tyrosine-type recombinase/integrase n=1 Tax=Paralcaligenes ureilyticus TaxID=627131 RepID=UPI00140512B8|nr:site-specific integrase [Paralcaligenes ureilyticus]